MMSKNVFSVKLFCYLIPLFFLTGCSYFQPIVIDSMATFHFYGKVLEEGSNEPIESVEIIFIDKGMDYARSRESEKNAESLTFTHRDGTFDREYKYIWGTREFMNKRTTVTGDFQLKFAKDGYIAKLLDFNIDRLPVRKDVYEVSLEVLLKRQGN